MNNTDRWFYGAPDGQRGPYAPDQIKALIDGGVIDGQTLVWTDKLTDWTPLGQTELKVMLNAASVTPPRLPGSGGPAVPQPPRPQQSYYNPAQSLLRNNQALGRFTSWALNLGGIVSAFTAVFIVFGGRPGGSTSSTALQAQVDRLILVENHPVFLTVALVVLALIVVLFLTWKYRVTANVTAIYGRQSITPAGAVYWYFVPVLFFWKPLEAMNNIYRAYNVDGHNGTGAVSVWWAFWLASLAFQIAVAAFLAFIDIQTYVYLSAAFYAVDAVGFYLASELVKSITAAEKLKIP